MSTQADVEKQLIEKENGPKKRNKNFAKVVVVIIAILIAAVLIFVVTLILLWIIRPSTHSQSKFKRQKQFPQLKNQIYLDAAGTALYTADSIAIQADMLRTQFMCNPHSQSHCSKLAETNIELARKLVLQLVGAGSYYQVVFTKSATHALSILQQSFPTTDQSMLMLHELAHTSVIGLRTAFKQTQLLNYSDSTASTNIQPLETVIKGNIEKFTQNLTYHLLAAPLKDNFYGQSVPKSLFSNCSNGNCQNKQNVLTLVDLSAALASQRVNLTEVQPHFAVFSAHKLTGLPSSVGCLIIRNDVFQLLRKGYFGGGTTTTISLQGQAGFQQSCGRYEDGTPDFYGIALFGKLIENYSKTIEKHQNRIEDLTAYCYRQIKNVKHDNKKLVAKVYGHSGGIVTFSVIDSKDEFVGHTAVARRLQEKKIVVRAGCMCNPGACYRALEIPDSTVQKLIAEEKSCGDSREFEGSRPLGAVRVSLGWWSVESDCDALAEVLHDFKD